MEQKVVKNGENYVYDTSSSCLFLTGNRVAVLLYIAASNPCIKEEPGPGDPSGLGGQGQ